LQAEEEEEKDRASEASQGFVVKPPLKRINAVHPIPATTEPWHESAGVFLLTRRPKLAQS